MLGNTTNFIIALEALSNIGFWKIVVTIIGIVVTIATIITFLGKILQKRYLKEKYKSNVETNKPFITLEIEEGKIVSEFIIAGKGRDRPAELVIKNTSQDDIAFKIKSFKIDEHANKPIKEFLYEPISNNKSVKMDCDGLFPNVGSYVYKLEYFSRHSFDEFCNCIIVEKSDYPSMSWNKKAKGDGAKLRLRGLYGRCKPCLYKEFLKNKDI